jgi:diaminopimelate epimerase
MVTTGLVFEKYEGAGNDFVLVRASAIDVITPAAAARLCDRHYGIGADGVLLVVPSAIPGCSAHMHVINADGSNSAMCGNGIRCVALMLAQDGTGRRVVNISTDAGARECAVEGDVANAHVTVVGGEVELLGACGVHIHGEDLVLHQARTGNPHAVLFGAASHERVAELGPLLSTHAEFVDGANIGFAQVTDSGLSLTVWERGAGLTLACGTGACAAVAVAWDLGLIAVQPTQVALPGGVLTIARAANGQMVMGGPARRVFVGALSADHLGG